MTIYYQIIKLKDGDELKITEPTDNAASEIVSFLNKVGGESDFLTFGENEFPLSIDDEKEIILECLSNNCLMLTGTIDNNIVSHLFIDVSSKPRLAHIGDLSVSVAKKYWGKSIGKKMVISAINWAKENNLTKIQLDVREDNSRAISMYKSLGFVIEGRVTRSVKVNDEYFDSYIMGLSL